MSFSPAQCRAARGLLGLSQLEIAKAAHLTAPTLRAFERYGKEPSHNNLQALRAALEAAGIVFVPASEGGAGVRLGTAPDGDVSGDAVFSQDLCRAARGLLNLSQQDLADAAGIARSTVAEFERGARATIPRNLAAMRAAFEAAGAAFIDPNGGGPGVRLRE